MTNILLREQVDIFELPSVDKSYKVNEDSQITIGDLHGNAMKLMFMLVKHGVATNINQADYATLVLIYQKPVTQLTKEDLNQFNDILNKIKFNKATIRLIGDELADRGSNDYFTLKILEKLNEQNVAVEIMISNHSVEFLQACEKFPETGHFHAPMLQCGHADSLERLQGLVEQGLVSPEEVLSIAKRAYKPALKVLSYTLSEDKTDIIIYSHAPTGINTIKTLAEQFEVPYKDSTSTELAATIDAINAKFQHYVQTNTVSTLCPEEAMMQGYGGCADLTKHPLVFSMWNRNYRLIDRPMSKADYHLGYAHGHDSQDPKAAAPNIYNLDNDLGKSSNSNKGEYTVLYSDKNLKVLAKEVVAGNPSPVRGSVKPTKITFEDLEKSFAQQLKEIDKKRQDLANAGHKHAAAVADKLYNTIVYNYILTNGMTKNVDRFKQECNKAIEASRECLEQHRGWKLVLRYLACAITGLGVLAVAADMVHKASTGKHLSFFRTDTAKQVDALGADIDNMVTHVSKPS